MQKYKTIDEFLRDLDDDRRAQVTMLRELILDAEPHLQEHIKWNAPSYVFDGDDRITVNLMNKQGIVQLVFHMGATRKEDKKGLPVMTDESGLMAWSSDVRGIISFASSADILVKQELLRAIVKNWLSIPVKM